MLKKEGGMYFSNEFQIPVLLWVDDVLTIAIGTISQKKTLSQVDDFAKKHKLRWGKEKCKVMRVGKHSTNTVKT